jgi:hypothetical protein
MSGDLTKVERGELSRLRVWADREEELKNGRREERPGMAVTHTQERGKASTKGNYVF